MIALYWLDEKQQWNRHVAINTRESQKRLDDLNWSVEESSVKCKCKLHNQIQKYCGRLLSLLFERKPYHATHANTQSRKIRNIDRSRVDLCTSLGAKFFTKQRIACHSCDSSRFLVVLFDHAQQDMLYTSYTNPDSVQTCLLL